jgi:glycine betaine catabolism B
MALLVSARTWSDALFRDELLSLEERADGFICVFALTREPAHRAADSSGRINDDVVRSVVSRLPAPPASVYICGSNAFVNVASAGVLMAGVQEESILTERYGV